MLSNLEIEKYIEATKDMREEDKIDYIYSEGFKEAMECLGLDEENE